MSRITKFHAENMQRLTFVEIKDIGKTLVIEGKNEAGKSSIFNTLAVLLMGKKAYPEMVIRKGEKKAFAEVEFGDYIVSRTITEKTDTLKMTTKDGLIVPSPQKKLDEIIGSLTFDPCEFASMDKKEQAKILKTVSGLDTSKEDAEYKVAYDKRTLLNRDIAQVEAQLKEYADITEAPKVRTIAEIQADIDSLNAKNQDKNNMANNNSVMLKDINAIKDANTNLDSRIDALKKQIKELEAMKNTNIERIKKGEEVLSANVKICEAMESVPVEKITALKTEMNAAGEAMKLRGKWEAKTKIEQTQEKYEADLLALEAVLSDIDLARKKKINAAVMPIPGLSVVDEQVFYNEIPLSQISGSLRIKVSMAMAMAINPNLKTVLIRDASLLDEDSRKVVFDMADKADFQVLMEEVKSKATGKKDTIYIDNGSYKAANDEPESETLPGVETKEKK